MVAEEGVRAVSFREVARRANVSHQAPYHHFGNYQGILRAVAREGFEALADAMSEAGARERDSLAALTQAGLAYVTFAREHVGHFRVMFQKTLVDVHDDEVSPEAERTHATLVRLASAAVEDGHGGGLEAEVVAQMCWSLVHGLATLMVEGVLARKQPLTPEQEAEWSRQVIAGLAHVLRAPKRGPARTKRRD